MCAVALQLLAISPMGMQYIILVVAVGGFLLFLRFLGGSSPER